MTPRPTRSVPAFGVAVVTAYVVGQAVIQFVFQAVLAALFGAGPAMDAFVAAWTVPLVASGVLAGAIGFGFVPLHAAEIVAENPRAEGRLIGDVLCLVLVGTAVLALAVSLLAGEIVLLLVPGFDSARAAAATEHLRWLVWLVPLQSLAAVLRAVQYGRGRFAWPGIAALAGGTVTLLWTVLAARGDGLEVVVTALLAGAATSSILLGFGSLAGATCGLGLSRPARTFLVLIVPLLLAGGLLGAEAFVDRFLASRMPAGTVAHLGYATRLTSAVLVVGVQGLSTVAFPAFARHVARGDEAALRDDVARGLRAVSFVFVPVVAGLCIFAAPAIRLLFERNEFDSTDTAAVAGLVAALCGVVAGGAIGEVLSKLVYAWRLVWLPVGLALLSLVGGTAAKLLLAPEYGVLALAWVSSATFVACAVLLAILVARRLGPGAFAGVPVALLRHAAATIAALGVATVVVGETRQSVLVAIVAAAGVYLGLNLACGDALARRLVFRRGEPDA